MLPEILLFGKAGSGKDTVAEMLSKGYGSISLAMADPMKRLCEYLFDFSENQLWGPSEMRNAPDFRYNALNVGEAAAKEAWGKVYEEQLMNRWVDAWVDEVLPHLDLDRRHSALARLRGSWWSDLGEQKHKLGSFAPRLPLQMLGTEWGRHIDDTMWVRTAQRAQRRLLGGGFDYHRKTGLYAKPGAAFEMATVTDGRFPNECLEFKAGGARVIKVHNPDDRVILAGGVSGHASEKFQDSIPFFWFDTVIFNDKSKGLAALQQKVDLAMTVARTWQGY